MLLLFAFLIGIGVTIWAMPQIEQRWGVLFQNGALFSALNVFDNIALPLRELAYRGRTLAEFDLTGVFVYRSLDDVEAMRARLTAERDALSPQIENHHGGSPSAAAALPVAGSSISPPCPSLKIARISQAASPPGACGPTRSARW